MADGNEITRRTAPQQQSFHESHSYPANLIPDVWVGQDVTMKTIGGRGTEHQLGSTTSSGMLEAVRADGFVLSVEDRAVYIPREAVLQIELYDSNRNDTSIDF